MHLLGCLFALVLGVFFIGAMFIGSIINFVLSLLGIRKRVTDDAFGNFRTTGQSSTSYSQSKHEEQQRQQRSHDSQRTAGQQRGKIFEKNDSEYVDFEEV